MDKPNNPFLFFSHPHTMFFEQLTIDNELSKAEINAISKIEKIDKDKIKTALKTEKITVKGSEKKLTFEDIADAFTTYDVKFSDNETTTNELIKIQSKKSFVTAFTNRIEVRYKKNTPQRLKDLVNDPNENDFVYFMNKLSKVFTPDEKIDETAKFAAETKLQLDNLKNAIMTGPTKETPFSKISEKSVNITVEVPQENAIDINIPAGPTSTTPEEDPTNSTPKEKTKEKKPKAKEVYSGMEIHDVFTKYGVTKQEINDAMVQLNLVNLDLATTLTSYFKAWNVKSVQILLFGKDAGPVVLDGKFGKDSLRKLKEANYDVKKLHGKIDFYGNMIISIDSTSKLPKVLTRKEKVAYYITTKDNTTYIFYGNGRATIMQNGNTIKNEDSSIMVKYINNNITKTPDKLDSFINEILAVANAYKQINENTKMNSLTKKLEIDKLTKKLEDIKARYITNTSIEKNSTFEPWINKEIATYKEKSDDYMRTYIFERISNCTTKATPEIQTPTQQRIDKLTQETKELPKIIALLNLYKNLYKNPNDWNTLSNVVATQNKNNSIETEYLRAKLVNINTINDIKREMNPQKKQEKIRILQNNINTYKIYYTNYLWTQKGNQDLWAVNAGYIN